MNDDAPIPFFSSRPRLVHMAINIALAPVLLYLVGIWVWPPTLPHYITFAITGLIAMRFAKQRWERPRLVVDHEGIHVGATYPWGSIRRMETVMRAVRLTLLQENGEVKQQMLNLGWASNKDFKRILAVLDQYHREHSQD